MQSQKLHSYLYQAALAFALMGLSYSCRMDDPNKSAGAQDKPKAPAVTMPIDLGDVEIDPATAIQYASPKMTVRGIEMNIPTRETETTPDGKTKIVPPTFSFTVADGQTEEPFPVFIALFGERHQKGCYGKATWKLVKETKDGHTRYFVRTKTQITFEENFAPDTLQFNNGEAWRLHAIYAPDGEWDATTQTYKWSAKKVVKKLYGPGDKLTIGKDIDIPFVLGYRSDKWNTGYPVKAVHSKYWNFEAVQQYGDDAHTQPLRARFRMLGSLYALRLKNDMRPDEPLTQADKDHQILGELKYRPTYDFSIHGFYVESTQAVTSVAYDFSVLYHALSVTEQSQQAAQGKDMKRDITLANAVIKEAPQAVPSMSAPTRVYLPFEKANYADLDRQSTTKTLYFWMSEVDASKRPNAHDGYGTSIWANLYNKTLKFPAGHTFVYTAKSAHKSGYAYSSLATLREELRINPLGRMGLDYISGTPNTDPNNPAVTCNFAREKADNGTNPSGIDPGAGSAYSYTKGNVKVRDFEEKRFQVNYIGSHEGTQTIDYGDLYWQVPDRYDLFSVFPYIGSIPGVSGGRWAPGVFHAPVVAGATTPVYHDEQARIDGRIYRNLRSIYYRKVATHASDQTEASSRNVTYAFRFIGTPMAVAVRYTDIGRWYKSGTFTSNTAVNPDSRFRIEMKSIGNAYKYKDLSDEEAKKVLLTEIAEDGYWVKSDGASHAEIVSRTIHVNGFRQFSLGNNEGRAFYGGQSIYIWTRKLADQKTILAGNRAIPGIYQNARTDNKGMHWRMATAQDTGGDAGGGHRGFYVLPWLSVDQSKPQS